MKPVDDWEGNWRRNHAKLLEGMRGRQVVVLYSGGKDSALSLELMRRLAGSYDLQVEAHAACFPLRRYPADERDRLTKWWAGKGVPVTWHPVPAGMRDPEADDAPCHACQHVRRRVLRDRLGRVARDWRRLVVVAGYSLDDLVSYAIEQICAGPLAAGDEPRTGRFSQTGQRFHPLTRLPEGFRVFRPLVTVEGPEVRRQVARRGLPVIAGRCPHEARRPKRLLGQFYRLTGSRFDHRRLMDFARRNLDLPAEDTCAKMDRRRYLGEIF